MASRYPLRRSRWDTVQWVLTAPLSLGVCAVLVAAGIFAGGMVTGRTLTPPEVYKQVTINEPFLTERAPNSQLSLTHLTCHDPTAVLRLTMTASSNSYMTVNGPRKLEAAGTGSVTTEMRVTAGDYDISYTGSALDWSTTGGSCTERH